MADLSGFAKEWNIDKEIVEQAVSNINDGTAYLIAVSGKIGAGKDTIAPLILEELGVEEDRRIQEYFARPLKSEINEVIRIIREERNEPTSIIRIMNEMGIDEEHAMYIYAAISCEVLSNDILNAYSRTEGIRKALQYWGTEVRRAQDENYWVRKMLQSAFERLSEGTSVYLTDTRFPNEADSVHQSFGITVRLDVSYEEQAKRIMSRDGIEVSEDARNHLSETALDDYRDFDVRVLTDDLTIDEVVQTVVSQMN